MPTVDGVRARSKLHALVAAALLIPVFLMILLLLPAAAAASEIPISAHSTSLNLPPALLDDPTLIFQYPQEAARRDPFVFALTSESGSPKGMGGAARVGGNSLFVLTQAGGRSWPSSLLQAGWARAWGGARLGVAARGTRTSRESQRGENAPPFDDKGTLEQDFLEGAVGFGAGSRAARLDAAIEVSTRHALESRMVESAQYSGREREVRRPFFQGHVRLDLPLGTQSHWVSSVSAGIGTRLWDTEVFQENETVSAAIGRKAQLLRAASAWKRTGGPLEELTLFGSFESSREPLVDFSLNSHAVSWNVPRTAAAGVAVRHDLGRGFRALAGARETYFWSREDITAYSTSDPEFVVVYQSTSRREGTQENFSWGVQRSWGRLHLTGAADLTLDVEDLFFALDVRVDL